ncbi:MAG: phenylalanine--tRNA ligase subunit beta [Chloroflexi bacterium]|nr:phenylalanine--tRNA ligase subunit beta [Chloroflexota bacterium]
MKVPLSWLREYVDIDLPPAELAHRLTMAGNEVGEIDVIGGTWDNVYVGQVVSVGPHPNADRLRLATVSLGNEEITVVCGAPNVAQGQRVAFAQVGASLIDSRTGETETLQAATIRGVVSAGMVCSERELGLGDDHSGIVVLPEDAPVGKPLAEYMGDVIFDIEVTPNRPDCLSVLGIAREVAAIIGKTVREPDLSYAEEGDPIESMVSVEIEDPALCPRYTASVIQGVKMGPSPRWMQDRLVKAGQRPISNVVDVTNYVMLEYGQPLHAFDYTTLKDGKIIVRPARDQEVFVTLDEVQRQLKPPMLVIADAERPVALAGVMGGLNTEMTENTTTVLLESANFDAINTRRTSQALRLRSESSSRFDKGLQPELAAIALRRATQLILQLAGGKACNGVVDAYPQPKERPAILFTLSRLTKVLGIEIPLERVDGILTSLGFSTSRQDGAALTVTTPYWRSDIAQEDDLVEEVARIIGYDNLPTAALSTPIPPYQPQPDRDLREHVKDMMVACGMQEVISYSLTSLTALEKTQATGDPIRPLKLTNPMSEEQEYLRTNLRSSILSTLAVNQRNVREGIKLFEMGRAYIPRPADLVLERPADLPLELETLVGVMAGPRWSESWLSSEETLDFFDAKGILEGFLGQLQIEFSFEPADDPLFLPGRCAAIVAGNSTLGVLGEVHPQTLEWFEIDTAPVALFELDMAALLQALPSGTSQYHQVPRYPGSYRDLALVLNLAVPAARVQGIIEKNPLVVRATLFDVYEGSGIATGMRSLAYRVLFQMPDRTLVGEEVGQALNEIVTELEQEVGASLRS